MHKRHLTLALCCGAVALAGCGSSNTSNSSTGAATGPSNPQVFTADLNALCKQAKSKVKPHETAAGLAAVIQQFLPKFRALTASGSQQATYAKYLKTLGDELTALTAQNVTKFRAANVETHALAKQLGATACA
jgi:hypothetical protein